jgi:hypothetical protein
MKGYWILTILIVVFGIGAPLYNRWYHEDVKKHPIGYAYQTYLGPPNSVLVIEDLDYKDSLIKYYEEMEDGKHPVFNFPLKTLPQNHPVYIVGYTDDSLLVKVISYIIEGKGVVEPSLKDMFIIRPCIKTLLQGGRKNKRG